MKAPAHYPAAYYHCVSRVVDRRFVLEAQEQEHFIRLMRCYEKFGHLRVLAYCVMSNHFHILVEVPKRPEAEQLPSDAALVEHLRGTLGSGKANELAQMLERLRSREANEEAEAVRERYFRRMWNVSTFMQTLKQRFSQWFNPTHDRCGTLWEGRFHSVLVEGACHALQAMAAYIELNPVRAGICDDPKDYRFCSHAEAVATDGLARSAAHWLMEIGSTPGSVGGKLTDRQAMARFRRILFGVEGVPQDASKRHPLDRGRRDRIDKAKALEVLVQGGELPLSDYLRCRARYFTAGVVLGSQAFAEEIFHAARDHFASTRQSGARMLRGLAASAPAAVLCTCRDLRRRVFG